jgi:chloramphenicol-sensitive protein RarD
MQKKYILAGLGSYLIWGFVPLVIRNLIEYDQSEVIAYRMMVAAVIMFIVVSLGRKEHSKNLADLKAKPKAFKRKTIFLTVIGTFLVSFNWLAYIYVVNNISVNAGAFAYLVLPIITAFLGFFILKEKLNRLKWFGIVLGVASCAIIGNVKPEQLLYVSVVTLTYSFYMITQRVNLHFNRRLLLFIQFSLGAIIMLAVVELSPANKPFDYWVNIGLFALIFTVIPFLLNLYALRGIESSQVAFMIYVNPIISFILGLTLYNEVLQPIELIAFGLLFLAIICFNFSLIKSAFFVKSDKAKLEVKI